MRTIRVLLAKPGLDGHDRGLKLIGRWLRDAGMEVIYLGLFQTVEAIVNAAIQENVDVIGISTLDGGHILIAEDIINLLKENGVDDITIVFGGIIPEEDVPSLEKLGVKKVFGPRTPMGTIVSFIQNLTAESE
jgi:methylmalonyl-CoA mutase C-terminal domain/subunit